MFSRRDDWSLKEKKKKKKKKKKTLFSACSRCRGDIVLLSVSRALLNSTVQGTRAALGSSE